MSKKHKRSNKAPAQSAPRPGAVADPLRTLTSPLVILAVMLALGFILYGRTLSHGFACDDRAAIFENKFTLQGVAGIPGLLSHDFFYGIFSEQVTALTGGRYRPLSLITFAVETEIFGVKPGVYHVTNILLYGLTGFMLFLVLRRIIGSRQGGRAAMLIPLVASLIFMAHPLHVEVVANIKSRDEELALLLSLFAWWLGMDYFLRKRVLSLCLAGGSLFLGLMSKESAIVFVAIIPLSAWFFLSAKRRELVTAAVGLVCAAGLYLAIRQMILGTIHGHTTDLINDPFLEATFGQKYATIFYTLLLDLKLLIFPFPLTFDYYPYHIPLLTWADWRPLLGFLLNLALLAGAIVGTGRRRAIALGIWLYLLPLSIVSNLVLSVGVFMAERFLYIPSLGFCLVMGYALVQWVPNLLKSRAPGLGRPVSWAVFSVFFLVFSAKSFDRTMAWKDDFTLATTDVEVSPESVKSNAMAGDEYRRRADTMQNIAMKTGYLTLAEKHLRTALRIFPRYEAAGTLLGRVLQAEGVVARDKGETAKAQATFLAAADAFRSVCANVPKSAQGHANLGALFSQQLWNPDSAMVHLRAALGYNDRLADAHYNLGTVFLMTGGAPDSALVHLERAVQLDSDNADAMNNLGAAYQFKGQLNQALAMYQRAFRLKPHQKNILENLSKIYTSMGDASQADYYRAMAGR